jgi:hypothetical protein
MLRTVPEVWDLILLTNHVLSIAAVFFEAMITDCETH